MQKISLLWAMVIASKFLSVCGEHGRTTTSPSDVRIKKREGYMMSEYFGNPFHNDSFVRGKASMEDLSRLPAVTFTMAELMLLASLQDVPLVREYPDQFGILKENELSAAVYTASGLVVSSLETTAYRFEELVSLMQAVEMDLRDIASLVNESTLGTANKTIYELERNIAMAASLVHVIKQDVSHANDYINDFVMAALEAKGIFHQKLRDSEKELGESETQRHLLAALIMELRQTIADANNNNQSIGDETFCKLLNDSISAMVNHTDGEKSVVSKCNGERQNPPNHSVETPEQHLVKVKKLLERTVNQCADTDAKIIVLSYKVQQFVRTMETLRKCFNPLGNTQLVLGARLLHLSHFCEFIMTSAMTDQIARLRRALFEPVYKCFDNSILVQSLQNIDVLAKFIGMVGSTFVDIYGSHLRNATSIISRYTNTTGVNVDQQINLLRNESAAAENEVVAIARSKFERTKSKLSKLL